MDTDPSENLKYSDRHSDCHNAVAFAFYVKKVRAEDIFHSQHIASP